MNIAKHIEVIFCTAVALAAAPRLTIAAAQSRIVQ